MDQLKNVSADKVVFKWIVGRDLFFYFSKERGQFVRVVVGNFENGYLPALKKRELVQIHGCFVSSHKVARENTKRSALFLVEGNPSIRNFRGGKQQRLSFYFNNFVGILRPVSRSEERRVGKESRFGMSLYHS